MTYDSTCILCGCPHYNRKIITNGENQDWSKYGTLIKEYNWLDNNILLTLDNQKIKCTQYNKYGGFDKPKAYTTMVDWTSYKTSSFSQCGIAVHADCWELIKEHKKIELKCDDFDYISTSNYPFTYIKQGSVTKYQEQDFLFEEIYKKDKYMMESPLKNPKNAKRVLKIFSKLKIRSNRPSPNISASLLEKDTRRLGNDKNIWVLKNSKWVHLKESDQTACIKTKTPIFNKLEDILNSASLIKAWFKNGFYYIILSSSNLKKALKSFDKIKHDIEFI